MPITVTPLELTDSAGADQAFRIVATSVAAELPDFPPASRQRFFGALHHPMPGNRRELVLAQLDGVPAGCLRIDLPQLDNTENISIDLDVLPAYRRRGVGRALFTYLLDRARELGRQRIFAMAPADPAGGSGERAATGFATVMGASSALLDVRRRLDLTTLDQAALDRLLADNYPRAVGYSLVRWTGPTPEEYLDDIAYLESRLLADAPMGDLEWEPEKVDAARIRGTDAAREAWGRRGYHCAMRHDESGRTVAWTLLDVDGSCPWHAYQQITIVDPGHRGHRLGTIVKAENLRYTSAHEPELRMIDTWNAASNEHMIAINEAVGFRAVDHWHSWQLIL